VRTFRYGIACLMCLGLFLLTLSASADDLRKVEYWNYAHCIQENFFGADAKVLDESCQCYASEVTPFMAVEYQQAVIKSAFPYKGPKPISDTMLGIVLMARCPATTPLVEKMWCGPNGENPAWCERFVHVRSGIFGGPEPWLAAPERGSAKVLAALTQSCLKDSGATGASGQQESCACFARETAPFHAQAFHDAVNSGQPYNGRTPLDQITEIGVMGLRCPTAADLEEARFCRPPTGSEAGCSLLESSKMLVAQ
jgi:hypothetical protein